MTQRAIVLYSGGMDSFTLLHHVRRSYPEVKALSFYYGQRHMRELTAARLVCDKLAALDTTIQDGDSLLDQIRLAGIPYFSLSSALTGKGEVPKGHYTDASMSQTVVPGRNTIMLSIALAAAQTWGASAVFYAAHAGDHPIYPDCRPEYIHALAKVFRLVSKVDLCTPFMYWSKGEILRYGLDEEGLGLTPSDYALTWSCYVGGDAPCGTCGACVERAEAFAFCKEADPLLSL